MKVRSGLVIASVLIFLNQAPHARGQESSPPTTAGSQAGKTMQGSIAFENPKGYMRAAFATVKGVLFLDPKKVAGIFVVYPNDGEISGSLRQEVLADIKGMFFHEKDLVVTLSQPKAVPPHTGDNDGEMTFASAGEMEVQVVTYQRPENSPVIVYGYFAMRHKIGKSDDGKFIDEQGKGVKGFEKFWQSFAGKKK